PACLPASKSNCEPHSDLTCSESSGRALDACNPDDHSPTFLCSARAGEGTGMWITGLLALLTATDVAHIGGGNALTLPAARHLVRLEPGGGKQAIWLLALQQDGAEGHWLGFHRSDDEAQTWRRYAAIQDNSSERDTADLLAVGMDVALVYSYEGPTLSGSALH